MYYYIQKHWDYPDIDLRLRREYIDTLGCSEITADLLLSRGIMSVSDASSYLNPDLQKLHDPFSLKDIRPAIKRIRSAIDSKENVLIFADRDADGITSLALIMYALKCLGGSASYTIPQQGYGMNYDVIQQAARDKVSLIITLDCGIGNWMEIDYAKNLGIDVVIIDHHEPPQILPKAIAVVDPKQKDCPYPHKQLAGCGVAFKVIQALLGYIPVDQLDLVALGTLADMMPLIGENRILVKHGLGVLQKTSRIGLSLLNKHKNITSLLNAPGRMGEATIGAELLLCDDFQQAEKLVERIIVLNEKRKTMQAIGEEEIFSLISQQVDLNYEKMIIISTDKIDENIGGLIASRFVRQYFKPVFILMVKEDKVIGSTRSIEGLDIIEALSHCKDLLLEFGGHKAAAGFSMHRDMIERFSEKIKGVVEQMIGSSSLIPSVKIDSQLSMSQLVPKLMSELELFQPFGQKNPAPTFSIPKVQVDGFCKIGKGKTHLKLNLSKGNDFATAIGWNMGILQEEILCKTNEVDIAFQVTNDEFRGKRNINLILQDLRPAL